MVAIGRTATWVRLLPVAEMGERRAATEQLIAGAVGVSVGAGREGGVSERL